MRKRGRRNRRNRRRSRKLRFLRKRAVLSAWSQTSAADRRRKRERFFLVLLALAVSLAAAGTGTLSGKMLCAWFPGQLPHVESIRERGGGQEEAGPRLRKRGVALFLEKDQIGLFQVEEEYERESD